MRAIDPLDAQRLSSVLLVRVKVHEVTELNNRLDRIESLLERQSPGSGNALRSLFEGRAA